MDEERLNAIESAEESLKQALNKNVQAIGFSGVKDMYEALETLKEAVEISSVDMVTLESQRGSAAKRVERVTGDRLDVTSVLTPKESHLYALSVLFEVSHRYENEPGYAGYDSMVTARRALLSPLKDTPPVEMVGERTGTPYMDDEDGNRTLEPV